MIGQIMITCNCEPEYMNREVEVLTGFNIPGVPDGFVCEIQFTDDGSIRRAYKYSLRKPEDGRELVKWSGCVWKPTEVLTCK